MDQRGELEARFDTTDWNVSEAAAPDLNKPTDTVTSYISLCDDMCVPSKT